MSPDEMRALGRSLLEAFSGGDIDRVISHFGPDFVDHDLPPGAPAGEAGIRQLAGMFFAAFPDLHYHVEDDIAEGNYLVQRVTGHGTQSGAFFGLPATGKHAMWSEIHISRFDGDKVVEHWGNVDQMGMMVQLGHVPPPGG